MTALSRTPPVPELRHWPEQNEAPSPCPRCGKTPRLSECVNTNNRPALYGYRYRCVKWFGLRTCFEGPPMNWIERDWDSFGRRVAALHWNNLVAMERGR